MQDKAEQEASFILPMLCAKKDFKKNRKNKTESPGLKQKLGLKQSTMKKAKFKLNIGKTEIKDQKHTTEEQETH